MGVPIPESMVKLMVTDLPYNVAEHQIQRLFGDIGPCRVTVKRYNIGVADDIPIEKTSLNRPLPSLLTTIQSSVRRTDVILYSERCQGKVELL